MHSYLLINKKNELKMESLRELSLNYRSKPAISEISKKKYDKKADKEHWPSNVVDRFKKYEENRQNHQIEL